MVNPHTQVWLLYGLSGSGKSYAGNAIGKAMGWPVYHADDDITPAMRQALLETRPFTDAMRDEYFCFLVEKIRERVARLARGQALVVTQGVYKQRHRDWLQAQIPNLGLIWIDAPLKLVHRRLTQRKQGISPESAAALLKDFEAPEAMDWRIINDKGVQHILEQFQSCIQRQTPRG